jgi:nickel superoxide dismutase
MTQRIKPDMENYNENLSLLHKILILSMKAKQTTDLSVIETMKETIHSFEHIYIGDDHTH